MRLAILIFIASSVAVAAQTQFPFGQSSTLRQGLISYWKLDEASGNRRDWVGGNNLVPINTPGSDTGVIGNSVTFTSAAANILVVTNTSLIVGTNSFTISMWFNRTNAGVVLASRYTGTGNTSEFMLQTANATPKLQATLYHTGGNSTLLDTLTVTSNAWHHATLFYDATAQYFGISLDGREITKSYTNTVTGANAPFRLGGGILTTQTGSIDEVGFWRRCLTPIERARLYNDGAAIAFPRFQATNINTGRGLYSIVVSNGLYNAFPGMVTLPNGHLLLSYYSGTSHIDNASTRVYKISADGGVTWGATNTTGKIASRGGDISLIGTNIVFAEVTNTNTTNISIWLGGVDGDNITWTNTGTIPTTYNERFFTASKVTALQNGSWLLPVYFSNVGDSNWSAGVITSSDSGVTWGSPVLIAAGDATYAYTEAGAVQGPSGRIYLIQRVDTDKGYMLTTSDDNGATWTAPAWLYQSAKPGYPSVYSTGGGIIFWGRWFLTGEAGGTYGIHTMRNRGYLGDWKAPILAGNEKKSVYQSVVRLTDRSVLVAWADEDSASVANIYLATYQHD